MVTTKFIEKTVTTFLVLKTENIGVFSVIVKMQLQKQNVGIFMLMDVSFAVLNVIQNKNMLTKELKERGYDLINGPLRNHK